MYHGETDEDPLIFTTDKDEEGPKLCKKPQILLMLNIKSYSGGFAPRLWQASTTRLGVEPPLDAKLTSQTSNPGDGKLDVMTLRYAVRVLTGSAIGGRRVFSGAPLHLDFHEWEDKDVIAFFNVDGEFYKIINPVALTITLKQRLKVLHSPDSMANNHDAPEHEPDEESTSDDEPPPGGIMGLLHSCSPCP